MLVLARDVPAGHVLTAGDLRSVEVAAEAGVVPVADRAVVSTVAPASRSWRTMAAPIPREPPVTRARFPVSSRVPASFAIVVMPMILSIDIRVPGRDKSACAEREFRMNRNTHPSGLFHGMPDKE